MKANGERRISRAMAGVVIAGAIGLTAFGGRLAGAEPGDEVNREQGDQYHAADLTNQNRFTGQGEVWPPRPDNAGAARDLPIPEPRYGDDPVIATVVGDDQVAPLLGDRWDVLAVGPIEDAAGRSQAVASQGRSRVTFFSRSTNQSVIVDVNGRHVADVSTVAPNVEQLPLNPEEKAEAVAIARQYWLDQGDSSVNDLEGFAIQAYQPGGDLYDVRMAYISFHIDADSRPELLAWVDLTNEAVTDAREDR